MSRPSILNGIPPCTERGRRCCIRSMALVHRKPSQPPDASPYHCSLVLPCANMRASDPREPDARKKGHPLPELGVPPYLPSYPGLLRECAVRIQEHPALYVLGEYQPEKRPGRGAIRSGGKKIFVMP